MLQKMCNKALILFFLLLSISTFGQEYVTDIVLDANYYQKPIEEVLVDISKKTKVNISFDPQILLGSDPITINVKQVTLGDFLDVILDDLNIDYKLNGKQIILTESPNIKEFSFKYKDISGFIEDQNTGERLPFAYIYTKDGEFAVATNEYGYYNFQIPENVEEVYVSYLGFKDTLLNIADLTAGKLVVGLQSTTQLEEVVIKDKKSRVEIEDYDLYVNTDIQKLRKVETFLGEFDVLRYVNSLPGVSTGADGLGGTSVRGANADNNLILLDDVPAYNSAHALGVFSIFNQESIKSASFHRSHIPAKYGGRLSSVLDIRTKEGSLTKYGGSISLGVLTAKAFVEGPIIRDKVSFAISARRTLLEPYIGPISEVVKRSEDNVGTTNYLFNDINAKIQFVLNSKNRVYLSYYSGLDAFNDSNISEDSDAIRKVINQSNYDWRWGNRLASLRWSSQFSEKVFSNLSIYNTSYSFDAYNFSSNQIDSTEVNLFYRADASLFNTSINDFGLNWSMDYYINSKNSLKYGLSAVNHSFQPGLVTRRINDPTLEQEEVRSTLTDLLVNPSRRANEFDLFIENKYAYKGTSLNSGVRASLINSNGTSYYSLQPRVAVKTKISKGIYAKLSANMTTQYLHLLASSGLGLPTDIWIPSTADIKPQRALQFAGGLDFKLAKNLFFSSEYYYKSLRNVLNLKEGAVFSVIEDADWESDIPVGKGQAYGLELGLKGQLDKHYFNINYTWGHSLRQFRTINSGRPFYSRFDRRHQAKLSYQLQINKNISANVNWVLATGHPQTLPTVIEDGEFIYTEKNNQRLPTYDRLDAGINISNDFNWGSQTIIIGVYNVYNKKNPYFYFLSVENDDVLSFQAKQITVFPILPNISYTIRF